VCVSPDSMNSRQVKNEYRYFLDAEKMVIPLICREPRTPYDLYRIQSISYRDRTMLVDELTG
jgi:hypothetical protein